MILEHLVFRSPMPASADSVFAWHCRPGAFERLSPPWESVKVLDRTGGVEDGGRVVLAVRAGGLWRRWIAEHCDYEQGRQFCDVQAEGPFAHWRHRHRVVPEGPDRCYLEDDVEYALPLGRLGAWLGGAFVRRKLERLFLYRHRITACDLCLHQKYSWGQPMKIAITGSTGLVGSALVPYLTSWRTSSHENRPTQRADRRRPFGRARCCRPPCRREHRRPPLEPGAEGSYSRQPGPGDEAPLRNAGEVGAASAGAHQRLGDRFLRRPGRSRVD